MQFMVSHISVQIINNTELFYMTTWPLLLLWQLLLHRTAAASAANGTIVLVYSQYGYHLMCYPFCNLLWAHLDFTWWYNYGKIGTTLIRWEIYFTLGRTQVMGRRYCFPYATLIRYKWPLSAWYVHIVSCLIKRCVCMMMPTLHSLQSSCSSNIPEVFHGNLLIGVVSLWWYHLDRP